MKRKMTPGRLINTIVVHIVLIFITIIILYPLVFIVGSAFSSSNSLAGIGVMPFAEKLTTIQFEKLFKQTNYLLWYRNTLTIAAWVCLCSVIVSTTAAYIFSRFRFPLRKQMMVSFLVLQVFPSFVGMVAIYVLLLRLGGLDTKWGLVLVYVAGNIPYNTWLVKGYMDSIPKSYDEAARIDGATSFGAFVRIILPIAKPIITFLAITSFTGPWMDFIIPRLSLRSDKQFTLALGLFNLINGKANNFYSQFAAGAVLVAVPFVLLFLLGQKVLTSALSSGVKE